MNIVVVESPSKAKTINKYLGPGYEVLASFGHIRDLPAKDGSVDPDNNFKMLWEVDPQSVGDGGDEAPARHRRRAGGFLSRPPRPRLSGRLHALARALAQAAGR